MTTPPEPSRVEKDSYRLAFDILDAAGVAVTPGIDFGEHGEGYLRLSFTAPLERLEEAMQRMAGVVRTIR